MRTTPRSLLLAAACVAAVACEQPSPEKIFAPSRPALNRPVDDDGGGGGGGGGGGEAIPPFTPPSPPFIFAANLTSPGMNGLSASCLQVPHAFWGFSNDVTQGTVIYVTGVVVPGTPMHWGIYNQSGVLVRDHWTQNARDNCVVHHEPEGVSTAGLAPGYYFLYASYVGITNNFGQETFSGYQTTHVGPYVGPLRVR